MGKFGKKNEVSLNPLDYNITILGESGIGKSSLSKEICEKLVGDNGYIHFDIGREFGADAIQGIVSERIEDWAKLTEVVEDIVENKTEDYPDLKTVIWDTLDELIILAENESIRLWNKKNPEKRADVINAAWGGFGKGQDKATELILNAMAELKNVGVSSIIVGHVKRSDITDPVTQETFSKLTADTTQRYFNAIKNKQHFVAVCYIDRDIVKEKTGRKNIVTDKEVTINKAVKESRVISFRDDTYNVDSKSRFADIVDHIPFGADEFITAMQDAILAEQKKGTKTLAEAKKDQAKATKAAEKKAAEYSKAAKENKIDEERNDELKEIIRTGFEKMDKEARAAFKAKMAELGIGSLKDVASVPTKKLEQLASTIE